MFPSHSRHAPTRAGMILVIVVAFLALAMSVGVAFVFYANQQAVGMRMYREAGQGGRSAGVRPGTFGSADDEAPPQPYDIANAALGQLIYDLPDDVTGAGSGLRGASLARAMYGIHYAGSPAAPAYSANDVPYNGIGRCRSSAPFAPALLTGGDFRAVNYTHFPADGFVRDPERIGYRAGPADPAWRVGAATTATNYFPLNAPYTYPDEKDVYLAAVRASDGRVLAPSFYRRSAFGSLDPSNPNWRNAEGKYLIQRPRPAEMGPGFPAVPANPDGSFSGDIEQLEGKSVRQNDSLWMDLDLPVRKWRGRYYKPLAAFLLVDLDGRVNLNVAGNRRGISDLHASNQGWGGWEIDPRKVILFNEASRLFTDPDGRYGSDRLPNMAFYPDGIAAGGNAVPPAGRAPFYAQIDLDASVLTDAGLPLRMQLPQAPSTRTAPTYPPRYAGASLAERMDHPLLYNPYLVGTSSRLSASPRDRAFGPDELLWLNGRFNGGDANYRLAELGRLLPQSLGRSCTPGSNGWPAGTANPRFLMTTISNDLDRPGLSPWILDRPTNYVQTQPPAVNGIFPPAAAPSAASVSFPNLSQRSSPVGSPNNINDFDPATWKAGKAALGSVDLSRTLADYRSDSAQPYERAGNVNPVSAARALADRQRLAKDIFDRLCVAAETQVPGASPGKAQYHALRYLAQLAANIVDQIDGDDYNTPFVWNPLDPANPAAAANFAAAELPNRVVFGTELPRLVINEACARVENGAILPGQPDSDPGLAPPALPPRATFYNVKVWAELHNPLTPGRASAASLSHDGGAPLTFGGNQVYRLLLTAPNARLRHAENVKGDPDGAVRKTVNLPAGVYSTVNDVVPASSTAYIQPRGPRSSFYVIGPETTPGDLVVPSATSDDMKFRIAPNQYQRGDGARATLLLQRLACPHLPPSADNPYITADCMEFTTAMMNDARTFDENGIIVPPPLGLVLQRGWGRLQPYAGHPSQVVMQNLIPAPVAGIHHTFFRHNGQGNALSNAGLTLTQPFDWLVHLDRPPVSPIELMHFSAYKPHELTQQFMIGAPPNTARFQHVADWSSDGARLYRALGLLEARNRTLGLGAGGRVPGKININTVWDEAVFQAVCDANTANAFTANDARVVWQKLAASRTPAGSPSAAPNRDRPFREPAAPVVPTGDAQFPRGAGTADTVLRPDPAVAGARILDVPNQPHPYLRNELLAKVFNHLTTRSNTFAVWMTVGYFEVTDRAARPVKLGPELGLNDGTNVRHRFFAIVDRTNLSQDSADARRQGPRPVFFSYEPIPNAMGADPATPAAVTAVVPAASFDGQVLRGVYDGAAWELRAFDQLVMDVGPAQELVGSQVIAFSPSGGAALRLTCGKAHARGCPLMIATARLGNPGPQPGFNAKDPRYAGVVRVFAALD